MGTADVAPIRKRRTNSFIVHLSCNRSSPWIACHLMCAHYIPLSLGILLSSTQRQCGLLVRRKWMSRGDFRSNVCSSICQPVSMIVELAHQLRWESLLWRRESTRGTFLMRMTPECRCSNKRENLFMQTNPWKVMQHARGFASWRFRKDAALQHYYSDGTWQMWH